MKQASIERILLIEAHRLVADAANHAVNKFGMTVPVEARSDYLSEVEKRQLAAMSDGPIPFSNSLFQKAMLASTAQIHALSYPLDGAISEEDADAIESIRLTAAQKLVAQRVIAEACHSVVFHFLCLLDSIADPELSSVKSWHGASLSAPRKEGPMLHQAFGDAFHDYRDIMNKPSNDI